MTGAAQHLEYKKVSVNTLPVNFYKYEAQIWKDRRQCILWAACPYAAVTGSQAHIINIHITEVPTYDTVSLYCIVFTSQDFITSEPIQQRPLLHFTFETPKLFDTKGSLPDELIVKSECGDRFIPMMLQ